MTPSLLGSVALAGAVGAVLRYLAELLHTRARERAERAGERPRTFPWATLAVNVVGSLLLGWVAGRAANGYLDDSWAAVLGSGLAGALTTYSTFSLDLVILVRAQRFRLALSYLGASMVAGLLAASAGVALGGGW